VLGIQPPEAHLTSLTCGWVLSQPMAPTHTSIKATLRYHMHISPYMQLCPAYSQSSPAGRGEEAGGCAACWSIAGATR
jgi:hypothetical protein